MSRRKIKITVLCILAVMVFLSSCSHAVFALQVPEPDSKKETPTAESILKATLLLGLETCYNDTYMKKSIEVADFKNGGRSLTTSKGQKDGKINVPTNFGNSLTDSDISCSELFDGYNGPGGTINGLFGITGKDGAPSSEQAKVSTLAGLGYYINNVQETDQQGCISLEYDTQSGGQYGNTQTTNSVCFRLSDGKMSLDGGGVPEIEIKNENNANLSLTFDFYSNTIQVWDKNAPTSPYPLASSATLIHKISDPLSWDEIKNQVNTGIIQVLNQLTETGQPTASYIVRANHFETGGNELYSFANRSDTAAADALHFFSGEPNATFSTYSLVSRHKYVLDTAYLNMEIANAAVTFGSSDTCSTSLDTAKQDTDYAAKNGSQWCPLYGVDSVSKKYNMVDTSGFGLTPKSFQDVVKELMSLDYDLLESQGIETGINTSVSGNTGTNSNTPSQNDQPLCYQAAATLGWILCPVLEAMGHVTSGIYEAAIEPFLTMDASLFTSTQNSPVRKGWSDFRSFANTLFAIVFVIVILAQITGIGISNYNIKKILPRLVMIVVLVNLSFIICQLAVDVSNILGSGLYNLFKELAKDLPAAGVSALTDGFLKSLGLTAVGAVTAFIVGTIAFKTWEIWLIPFLLALLGCAIGVIFFFITLAVRQAGIIILMVISPIAIICYALPNTKAFFDRWKKMFMSLLVVYPICGILIGGGQYAAALLAREDSSNLFFNLAAMLVQIVPFFMIPSIVRSSMTAIGNLGNKIAGFGQRLSGGLQRGIRNSAPVQDWQRSLDMNNAKRAYNRAQKKIIMQGGEGKASHSALRRRSRAATRYNRLAFEDIRAGGGAQLLSEDNPVYNALIESESEKQRQENVNGYQTLIANNTMGSAAASGNVNGSNEDELGNELDYYLDTTMKGIKSGKSVADLRDNVNRAQAYINALSAKGTGSARAKVMQSFSKMMQDYSGDLQNPTYRKALSSTINTLGSHTLDKYAGDYKKDNPGNARMLSDIAAGKYTADNTKFASVSDGSGKTHLHSDYYSRQGITGASATDFSKMKSRNVGDLLRTINSGHINGEEVLAAARLSDNVLSDQNAYQPDTDAIAPMSDVRLAAYGSQVAGTKANRSAGSQAIGLATTNGLRAIADKIQTAGDWSSMSADDQQYYGGLLSNMNQALQNETFAQADANILHSAAEVAQKKGFRITTTDSSGATTVTTVDAKDFTARNIKVGTGAQRRLETDLTAGGTYKIDRKKMRQGDIEGAVTRTDGAAMSDDDFDFIYKGQAHNAEVQRWNTENGFGPTPPPSGSGSGSGSGSAP